MFLEIFDLILENCKKCCHGFKVHGQNDWVIGQEKAPRVE